MFMGLAIVADDYFVPALDKLAESKYSSTVPESRQKYLFGSGFSASSADTAR